MRMGRVRDCRDRPRSESTRTRRRSISYISQFHSNISQSHPGDAVARARSRARGGRRARASRPPRAGLFYVRGMSSAGSEHRERPSSAVGWGGVWPAEAAVGAAGAAGAAGHREVYCVECSPRNRRKCARKRPMAAVRSYPPEPDHENSRRNQEIGPLIDTSAVYAPVSPSSPSSASNVFSAHWTAKGAPYWS